MFVACSETCAGQRFLQWQMASLQTPEQLAAGGAGQVHWPGWPIKTVPSLWLCTVFSNCSEFDFQVWILFMLTTWPHV